MMVPRYQSTTNRTAVQASCQVEGPAISKAVGRHNAPLHLDDEQQQEVFDNDDTSVTFDSSSASLGLDQCDVPLSRLPQHLSNLTIIEEPRRGSLDSVNHSEAGAADPISRTSTLDTEPIQRKGILKHADAGEEVKCRLQQWILKKNKKEVSFSSVDIRKYAITMGDNPACRYGVPLSLGWDFQDVPSEAVGKYERRRTGVRRKYLYQLALSARQRGQALKRCGFEDSDLKKAQKKIAKVQRQRNMTIAMQPLYKMEKLAEKAGRGVRKALRRYDK
jgi:hypothetical protein